jgi:hypothetical protein
MSTEADTNPAQGLAGETCMRINGNLSELPAKEKDGGASLAPPSFRAVLPLSAFGMQTLPIPHRRRRKLLFFVFIAPAAAGPFFIQTALQPVYIFSI